MVGMKLVRNDFDYNERANPMNNIMVIGKKYTKKRKNEERKTGKKCANIGLRSPEIQFFLSRKCYYGYPLLAGLIVKQKKGAKKAPAFVE